MKQLFFMACLLGCVHAQAQYNITFHLKTLPSYHLANAPVFITGDFNNWNPGDSAFGFANNLLTIQLPKGTYEYKFTGGTWQTTEAGEEGKAVENRKLDVKSDTTIVITIMNWADHFPAPDKKSTASKNVHIIDTAFYMPQLNRHRRIWIYLPEHYASSRKKYPVLYMHDGQNVFDDATSYAGEWGVDETLDAQTGECIVVAIDNGGDKRMNEYAPYDMEKWGKGEGDAYIDFIVKTLKPYIQKHYRVRRGHKHQFIAGSSMGGLISFYAMLKYPKAFGGAGVFSPAFWVAPQLKDAIETHAKHVKGKIYFYAGKEESARMVPDMLAVLEQMSKHSKAKMETVIRSEGQHSESRWRQEFPLFYNWLMK